MDRNSVYKRVDREEDNSLIFRAASREDYPAIVEMTKDIWGGNDYLPSVWRDWVTAPNSFLQVGTIHDEVVATGRLVEQLPGHWWMEALRVHPKHQGRGYATVLHNRLVTLAMRQPGIRSLGLATNWDNEKISHLASSSGMTLRTRYRYLRAPALAEPVPGVARDKQMEAAALLDRLLAGRWLAASDQNLLDGWVVRPLDERWLTEIIREGGLWRCGDALALMGVDGHNSRIWLLLVEGGSPGERASLIRQARHLIYRLDPDTPLRAFVPPDGDLQQPLLEAGMHDPEGMGEFYLSHFKMDVSSPNRDSEQGEHASSNPLSPVQMDPEN